MKSPGLFSVNKSVHNGMCAALCILAAVGCGSADQRPQVTTFVADETGGGVSGGPLTDTLTVYAIDADSGQPVASAAVLLGSGQSAHQVGQTDRTGKLTISGLDGTPQMVSLSAKGYAAATWGLIKSATATIPLESMVDPTGEAALTVSIPGWNDLPPLADGAYRIARFAFSRPRGLEALEAALISAPVECKQTSAAAASCSVSLSVPADSTAVLAVIAEGTDAGTPDDMSDDELTVTALAIQTGLSLQAVAGKALALPLLDTSSLAFATLVMTTPTTTNFQDVIGVPGISLDGQILLYPSLGSHAKSFLVPTASGAFVNAKLWAVATADNGNDTAWSRVYERGIDPAKSASESINLATSSFIESPVVTKTGPSTYAITGDGNVDRLEFTTPSEKLNTLLFPPQTEFEIPAGLLSEEPMSASVESFDLEVDLSAFDFVDLAQSTRIAYARVDSL